ncbi:MAG TPA: DNA replication and repair protein RecF, partial [Gemmatimonadales bacterium]|nr:DNA replication and repair protein RecF [Gemmatimonadales bacterium]
MRAVRLAARGFRNLADFDLDLPSAGGVFLGPNGHGKTSLLEALYYPVLFRSFRGSADPDLARWGGSGFGLAVGLSDCRTVGPPDRLTELAAVYSRTDRRRRTTVDGVEGRTLSESIGHWLAVAFLPTDLSLVQGAASERRAYLDRVLSLSYPEYFRALLRYRRGLTQRNSALRQGRTDLAQSFESGMAGPGAVIIAARLAWTEKTGPRFGTESAALGEAGSTALRYKGEAALADPGAWPAAFAAARRREESRGVTLVGPQRDDLLLDLDGHSTRDFGSTGQQRTAAVALKLCELATIAEMRGTEPALLLDDVFAELDEARQAGLAERLKASERQVFVTAPRRDELPEALD